MSYNILVINWQDISNPLGGGAEVHLHEIFKRVAQKGHRVTLLCHAYKGAAMEEVIDGIQIIRRGSRYTFNFSVPGMYRKLSSKYHFDVVFDDINKIPFYTPLYVKEPLIGIVHHLFGSSIFIETVFPLALYVYVAEKFIPAVYHNTPIMAVSESTRLELIEKGMKSENVNIVYNAVDHEVFRPLKDISKDPQPLVGYLGRLKRYKSIDHLIRAMKEVIAQIPQARLVVIGDGDNLQSLKKLTSDLKLEQSITFTGAAADRKKVEYLNRMWVAVNPSPKEGWGLTVVEANACGTPVIAANSPGLRDSVIHGQTGLLYDYGDIQQLADTIIKILTNEELRKKLTYNSLQWSRKFNWEESANKTLNIIEKVIRG